jgi:multidrug transporter EmrE-like cation transporter
MNLNWDAWVLVFIAGINTCIGNLFLKQSRLVATDRSLFSMLFSPWFIGGLLFFGINVIIFTKSLDKLPVSIAYPVLAGLGFSLLAISGNLLFGERLVGSQLWGVALILAGIIIVSRS